ncbi:hypothetical protein LP421_09910 [Rhizobium sp. RCAM05350]|nr:hypothetical protein LP421_09910 [Rhizobium sp. RCAM05350]
MIDIGDDAFAGAWPCIAGEQHVAWGHVDRGAIEFIMVGKHEAPGQVHRNALKGAFVVLLGAGSLCLLKRIHDHTCALSIQATALL